MKEIELAFESAKKMQRVINKKINKILEKYDEKWIGDEAFVNHQIMSEHDNDLYIALFDLREYNSETIRSLTVASTK